MGTYLEPGTFNFVTPAQDEPITTRRMKKSQTRRGDGHLVKIVSPAEPPIGDSRPILNVPAELLVEIIAYGSQKDKLAWMLVSQKFVDPAERALWRICGRKGFIRLLRMTDAKRQRLVKMISHLNVGDNLYLLDFGIWRHRSHEVQYGVYPDQIPMLPASWVIHPRLKSFTALSGGANGAIDDDFAALKKTSTLEALQINHHIERNTPTAFPRLLECLPRLRVFEAHYFTSGTLLAHLAPLPALKKIVLGGNINLEMVQQAVETPGAFNELEALDITVRVDAATRLFQHLPNLKNLRVVLERTFIALSDEERADVTISSLQAIGAMSSLTLLHIRFVYRELFSELKALKQLSSLRKLDLTLQHQGADRPLPDNHTTDLVEQLSHLQLEEFYCDLDLKTAQLESLSKACPTLRGLRFYRWHDLDDLDTEESPILPTLEHLAISNYSFGRPVYSKKWIKTWANKLAVAAPVLSTSPCSPSRYITESEVVYVAGSSTSTIGKEEYRP
ncbi:hypothetical protein KCU81_g7212, partial [Aureobasidium melanogenum]|uniref:F-box domain-containing protein n=1 Tax=Aureobasidium melanogenum (strain CBS 110374) TaxID=1043003 RepID=A0A074VDC5_AURM1